MALSAFDVSMASLKCDIVYLAEVSAVEREKVSQIGIIQ